MIVKKDCKWLERVIWLYVNDYICHQSQCHNSRVLKVNDYLQKICFENRFYFIDNSKIKREHLFRDGLHLLESGKVILANNFIYYLNSIHSVNFDENL